MNYAINRDEINKVIALGLGQPSSAILPKEHWAHDPATANYYKHDIAKAKALLAEAGHPNGIDVDAYGWSDQTAMQRQELIISQLAQAGIRIKLTPASPGPAMQSVLIEQKAAMLISPTGGYPDPSQFYEACLPRRRCATPARSSCRAIANWSMRRWQAPDQAARKAAFAKLQRFVIEQALQLPQFISPNIVISTKRVQDFQDNLPGTPKFQEVWLSESA